MAAVSHRSRVKAVVIALAAAASVVEAAGCRRQETRTDVQMQIPDGGLSVLSQRTIFFGHQSVGRNILEGVRELMAADPRIRLRVVDAAAEPLGGEPGLLDFRIGRNGDPASKNASFLQVLAANRVPAGAVLISKYCYADIDGSTNVEKMFADYRGMVAVLRSRYPQAVVLHTTVPLTVSEPLWKYRVKKAIGHGTGVEVNARRNHFNDLLRAEYRGKDPIFDIAEAESTHADGSRQYVDVGGRRVYTLASEWSDDGSHFNQAGRRMIARRLLETLVELPAGDRRAALAGE
jgi:hypothetical protein